MNEDTYGGRVHGDAFIRVSGNREFSSSEKAPANTSMGHAKDRGSPRIHHPYLLSA